MRRLVSSWSVGGEGGVNHYSGESLSVVRTGGELVSSQGEG